MDCALRQLLTGPLQDESLLGGLWQRRLLLTFLTLGVAARCVRYFLCFPLWEDECFLCTNFIDRGYAELLQPLNYHQVAPPLFLWAELTFTRFFGFSEFSLRLFPFVLSVAGLILYGHVARRLVSGPALLFAVAIFAVAYPCIRYAAEAKPYGSDLFVSLGLLALAVEWWRRPEQTRWLWLLAGVAPVAVGLSYPAVFTASGLSLFVVGMMVRRMVRRVFIPWAAFNVSVAASFGAVYFLAIRPQSSAELGFMTEYWHNAFPPLASPLELPRWALLTHTGDLFAYPVGGGPGSSTLTFLCIVAAVVYLCRRQPALLLLTLAPLAVHLAAAALQRYPYGVHVKYSQYAAPSICLLAGLGLAAWLALLRHAAARRPLAGVALGVLALIGLASIARDIAFPYKSETDLRARAFARWFWFNSAFDSETVCLKSDLGIDFSAATFRELSWSAMYLCNQRIYSPRHHRGEAPAWNRVTAERPLRVVQFKAPFYPYDAQGFGRWLEGMKERYDMVSVESFAFPCYAKRGRRLTNVDYVEIYKFVPRGQSGALARK